MNRKEEYQALMNELAAPPAGLENSVSRARARHHSRRRPLRPVLAAACLCAVLVGTSLAVTSLVPGLGKTQSGQEQSEYYVEGDLERYSAEELPDSLKADLAAGTVQRQWEDKESLEAYLGVKLVDSPAFETAGFIEDLEESVTYGWKVDEALAEFPDARYVLTPMTLEGQLAAAQPEQFKISAHRVLHNTEIILRAQMITDHTSAEALEEGLLGMAYEPTTHIKNWIVPDGEGGFTWESKQVSSANQSFSVEVYKMPCGLEAIIVTATDQTDLEYEGFAQNVHINPRKDYMGHFIYEGVLYTVYPHAIYDPDLRYPFHNDDMYDVLKEALDTFALS